jgi:hypothetical protein
MGMGIYLLVEFHRYPERHEKDPNESLLRELNIKKEWEDDIDDEIIVRECYFENISLVLPFSRKGKIIGSSVYCGGTFLTSRELPEAVFKKIDKAMAASLAQKTFVPTIFKGVVALVVGILLLAISLAMK